MTIKLPQKFDEKLTGSYRAYIDNTLVEFSSIYTDNKLEFFPEFTDHGINHIEDVLTSASNLIPEESYKYLNDKDIAVLIMSVILHDVGMHITSEGLKKILSEEYNEYRECFFDSKSWKDQWAEFLYEAKRFNDDQLIGIFGNSSIEIVQPDINDLTDTDKRLYGEFLRRYHHRLAHEIAFGGFPTKLGEPNVKVHSNLEEDIIDLCGLVARSHGMRLRDTFEYLKNKHEQSWKMPYGIKAIYLMVVLRISDYIQLHRDRANQVLVKTKKFSSPTSIQEWEKHNAIKDININTDDPERIYITAKPIKSQIFLELKKLLKDIQNEFDISWAVLGEVYGRDNNHKNLKIEYRRIASNLDNIENFSKTVDFIPERIRFDADPELLKLLIGPLYGEDPKYGVRELLQNSVDAVKERKAIDEKNIEKIIISINKLENNPKKYSISIRDNGIGMTKDTIINFFFKAGASFRNSMVWKKDFIKNNEVVIEKTGRFGVGVLAAFLLGNEFELYTRYHKDQKGFKCHASLSSRQVELLKCECKIGTYIKIDLNDDINAEINKVIKLNKNGTIKQSVSNSLDWFNWYLMSSPKLDYEFENDDLKLIFSHSKQNISSKPEHPNNGWYSFETEDFKAIHWTINNNYYSYKSQKNSGELYCNGFKISRGYDFSDCNYPYNAPKVSVFDGNARMPLSLNRDYLLNDKLPFEKRLATEIFNKIIDVLLKVEFEKRGSYWIPRPIYLELKKSIDLSEYIIIKGNSYTLKLPFIFRNLDVNVLYSIWLKNISANNTLLSPDSFYQPYIKNSDPNYFYKDLLELSSYKKYLIRRWFMLGVTNTDELHIKISHQNNYILNDKVLYMFEKNRLTKSFKESHKHQLFNDQWSIVTHKRSKNNNNNSKILTQNLASKYYYFISENYIKRDDIPEKSWGLFEEIWIKRFKSNSFLIPIDKDSR